MTLKQSPSLFSGRSSSENDSERKLYDDVDAATETSEDSSHLEWWEEADRKGEEEEEEEDKMLEEQEVLVESFATTRFFGGEHVR
jgi:hypothetical protein